MNCDVRSEYLPLWSLDFKTLLNQWNGWGWEDSRLATPAQDCILRSPSFLQGITPSNKSFQQKNNKILCNLLQCKTGHCRKQALQFEFYLFRWKIKSEAPQRFDCQVTIFLETLSLLSYWHLMMSLQVWQRTDWCILPHTSSTIPLHFGKFFWLLFPFSPPHETAVLPTKVTNFGWQPATNVALDKQKYWNGIIKTQYISCHVWGAVQTVSAIPPLGRQLHFEISCRRG